MQFLLYCRHNCREMGLKLYMEAFELYHGGSMHVSEYVFVCVCVHAHEVSWHYQIWFYGALASVSKC